MKERPLLFSGPMVRAILEGRKTQTRRVVKPQPFIDGNHFAFKGRRPKAKRGTGAINVYPPSPDLMASALAGSCPYAQPGDRLWVRETWDFRAWEKGVVRIAYGAGGLQVERVPPPEWSPTVYNYERWRPSIHMPRWASRILLEVTAVRVERVQDISEEDAKEEGVLAMHWGELKQIPTSLLMRLGGALPVNPRHVYGFAELWDSINSARGFGWGSNPWVWVIEFKRIEATK